MMDPRVERHAQVLVDYSARIQPGDRVAIEAEAAAEPLVRAVFERVLEAGGHPQLLICFGGLNAFSGIDDIFLRKANDEQLAFVPSFWKLAYETFESRIRILSLSNTKMLSEVDPARMRKRRDGAGPITRTQFERGARGDFRWVTTLHPTQAYAQEAEMSLSEYETFVYQACHVADAEADPVAHWQQVRTDQARFIEALEGADWVRVRGPDVDLRLSLAGRTFLNACGDHNMPDGEIFTGPVEDSVEGWVRYTYPAIYQGRMVSGVELHFEKGRVANATAERGQDFLLETLETDSGARYVGEFAIGLNNGIQRHTRNILFDEKIGGSFHMALGAGYPETGSKNQSAIHWDMICDLKKDSRIEVDGETVYENGSFVI